MVTMKPPSDQEKSSTHYLLRLRTCPAVDREDRVEIGRRRTVRRYCCQRPFDHLDRKSTRLNSSTNAHLVCRLLLEKKKHLYLYILSNTYIIITYHLFLLLHLIFYYPSSISHYYSLSVIF